MEQGKCLISKKDSWFHINGNVIVEMIYSSRKAFSNKIFLSCFPKSGSSYISNYLNILLCYKLASPVCSGNWYKEHDLCEHALKNMGRKGCVAQMHTKATQSNIELFVKYKIEPLVLVRNIYDCLVSHYDHIHNLDRIQPVGYVNDGFFDMSLEQKKNVLIEIHLPWYVNYYASWYENITKVKGMWITYEQLIEDHDGLFEKILLKYSLEADVDSILRAKNNVVQKNIRFNKGVKGRGVEFFDTKQAKIIADKFKMMNLGSDSLERIGINLK